MDFFKKFLKIKLNNKDFIANQNNHYFKNLKFILLI